MTSLIDSYQDAVFATACAFAINAAVNFAIFRRPSAIVTPADVDLPMISVLVPARDEAENIERCVTSALALNYPNYEVVVLDDGSTDDTYAILCRIRDRDPRLRILIGSELPAGWCGKPHACWQLAQAARGEYLLMIDADCTVMPDALLQSLGALRSNSADGVSLLPDVRCETFWEKLILPTMTYIVYAFLPIALVRGSRHHWFAPCNGAFIFIGKSTYFEIDGHRAVKDQIAEDIKFAQNLKRRGKSLWYGDGSRTYSVRMYRSLEEIVAGFTKNLYPAFDRNAWLMLPILSALTVVFVLPPLWAVAGMIEGKDWTTVAFATYLLGAGIRLGLTARYRNDGPLYFLATPLSWAITVFIALRSMVMSNRSGSTWKGRSYPGP